MNIDDTIDNYFFSRPRCFNFSFKDWIFECWEIIFFSSFCFSFPACLSFSFQKKKYKYIKETENLYLLITRKKIVPIIRGFASLVQLVDQD